MGRRPVGVARARARLDPGAGRRRYLALLLKPLGKRLAYNVPDERLVALARAAPELRDPHRAKALAEAGYRTPADIASASPEAIARVLLDKEPFELRAGGGQQHAQQHAREQFARSARRIATKIIRACNESRARSGREGGPT